MKKIILLLSITLLLTSCNNDSAPVDLSRCINIPIELEEGIESGLTISGGGELINVQAVKSNDFENVYFISGYLKGEGIGENQSIATFTTNNLELGKGLIGSVNSHAKGFSEFPTLKDITQFDDGAELSEKCVSK